MLCELEKSEMFKEKKEEIKKPLLDCVRYAFNEVRSSHNWMVNWKKLKEILVLGNDKKEFFKEVKNYDEDNLNPLNEWLKENNFT